MYNRGMKTKLPLFALAGLLLSLAFAVAVPLLVTNAGLSMDTAAVGPVHMTVVGFLVLILIVETVSVFKIDDSTFHTVLIAGSLLALYFFSTDTVLFFQSFGIRLHRLAVGISSQISFVLSEGFCIWYILFLYGIRWSTRTFAAILLPVMFSLLGGTVALNYGYGFVPHIFAVVALAAGMGIALWQAERRGRLVLTTYFVVALFCLSAGAQTVNVLGYDGRAILVPGLTLAYAILTALMFFSVYFAFSAHADLKAVQSDKYKSEAQSFKTKALSGQIQPHFIFNALEAVRSLYHRDMASGDEAVTRLSEFLRESVNAFDDELVPFEQELDTVYNYTEFENLKRPKPIEVIFDTDYTDFRVPPFAVQPFVENAFRYSGVEEREDGRVVISSTLREGVILLEISDNGRGFDPAKIKESSHGIRNACERFEMLLDTTPHIDSAPGKGTRILIAIEPMEEADEDRDH